MYQWFFGDSVAKYTNSGIPPISLRNVTGMFYKGNPLVHIAMESLARYHYIPVGNEPVAFLSLLHWYPGGILLAFQYLFHCNILDITLHIALYPGGIPLTSQYFISLQCTGGIPLTITLVFSWYSTGITVFISLQCTRAFHLLLHWYCSIYYIAMYRWHSTHYNTGIQLVFHWHSSIYYIAMYQWPSTYYYTGIPLAFQYLLHCNVPVAFHLLLHWYSTDIPVFISLQCTSSIPLTIKQYSAGIPLACQYSFHCNIPVTLHSIFHCIQLVFHWHSSIYFIAMYRWHSTHYYTGIQLVFHWHYSISLQCTTGLPLIITLVFQYLFQRNVPVAFHSLLYW